MEETTHAEVIEEHFTEKEDQTQINGTGTNKTSDSSCERFKLWLIGFGMSCIPIIIPPIAFLLFSESVPDYWKRALSSADIIFIGITLCITAMYDLISQDSETREFPWGYVVLLILGGSVFGFISAASELSADFNYVFAIVLNFSFLVIAFIRGIWQYAKK